MGMTKTTTITRCTCPGGSVVRASAATARGDLRPCREDAGFQAGRHHHLAFTPATTSTTAPTMRGVQVTLTGHLVDDNAELSSVSRTITQDVFVRSVGQK